MIAFFLCITMFYVLLIGSFIIGFDKVKQIPFYEVEAKTTFSIIIPFKNEAENLSELLKSISELNFPKELFEIILVNDDSEDGSIEIVENFLSKKLSAFTSTPLSDHTQVDIKIIENERKTISPKKDAINTAISKSKFDWIVTTDADCVVPKYWLDSFDSYIQKNDTEFIVAPVAYHKIDSFLKRFQTLDFLSLIGATIGGFGINKPFLCNGANIAYRKEFFKNFNGYQGNTNIASGDDIFLLEKAIATKPNHVHFLKSEHSIVKTKPQPSFSGLLSQRIRWAAKTSSYSNLLGKSTGLVVLLMNATIVCSLFFVFIGVLNFRILAYIFIIKLIPDFFLIYKTAHFFKQQNYLSSFLTSSFLYPFFSVFVAINSIFKGYKWKGRNYKK